MKQTEWPKANLTGAIYNALTVWPDGFDPVAAKAAEL